MRERESFEIVISVISLRRTEPWVESDRYSDSAVRIINLVLAHLFFFFFCDFADICKMKAVLTT